jgi:hypothetical protein
MGDDDALALLRGLRERGRVRTRVISEGRDGRLRRIYLAAG